MLRRLSSNWSLNNCTVDDSQTLAKLATTILNYYTAPEKNDLLKPTDTTLRHLNVHHPPIPLDIRRLLTRNQYPAKSSAPKDTNAKPFCFP